MFMNVQKQIYAENHLGGEKQRSLYCISPFVTVKEDISCTFPGFSFYSKDLLGNILFRYSSKSTLFTYTDHLCSPSVQPLSVIDCLISYLFNVSPLYYIKLEYKPHHPIKTLLIATGVVRFQLLEAAKFDMFSLSCPLLHQTASNVFFSECFVLFSHVTRKMLQ